MANHYGATPIVSNGLVFCVDGKDKHSNPANGSTITDLIKDKSGTVTNATLSGDYAPTFDGSGDRIDFSAHDDFNFGDGDFTIAIWWRYTGSNFNGYPYLLDMRGSGNVIVIYPINTNKIEVYTNGNQWNTGSETLTVNNWFHIVYCRVGTTRYLYVNNSLTNSESSYTTTLVEGKLELVREVMVIKFGQVIYLLYKFTKEKDFQQLTFNEILMQQKVGILD